ncbi:MAG: hypothetical protein K1X87_12565 [Dehalococcoidia bacterium]|nr:hypothetical protein [Dehalococcoidia bacterium]
MYSVVRQYQHILNHEDFIRHVRDEFLPELRQLPGFAAFHLVDVGEEGGRMVSITYFETPETAAEANNHAVAWVRANMGLFQAASVVEEGPVVVSS